MEALPRNVKHLAFDLDGVLIDALSIHRGAFVEAWNAHVPDHPIDAAFHDAHLASRNTVQKVYKLIALNKARGYDFEILLKEVPAAKQKLTAERIDEAQATVPWLRNLLCSLRDDGRLIALVSNSIRATCERTLANVGILDLFDTVVASDDHELFSNKPSGDPYILAARRLGQHPEDLVAFEDSTVGLRAARSAGCWLYVVSDPNEDLKERRIREWLRVVDAV